jgi:hypothetical protein
MNEHSPLDNEFSDDIEDFDYDFDDDFEEEFEEELQEPDDSFLAEANPELRRPKAKD